MVGFRIQQRVQRLFDRRPNHFVQMRLNAPFVDLYYRSQVPLGPVLRPNSGFHGWLHRARLRGLAPPACTNLHDSNSNQCAKDILRYHSSTVDDGEIRYQFGEGCLSDQLLGAWFADMVGLDNCVPKERTHKALESIYRYNFQN